MGILQVPAGHELRYHSLASHSFNCCQDYHWSAHENIVLRVECWRMVQHSTGLEQSYQHWCKAEGPMIPGSGERGQHPWQAASSPATVSWPAATRTVLMPDEVIGLQLQCPGLSSVADCPYWIWLVIFQLTVLRVHQVASFLFRSEEVLLSSPRQLSFSKTFASWYNRF